MNRPFPLLAALAATLVALTVASAPAAAQYHHDRPSEQEIRRGLARRAATSDSPEARRYRAARAREIHREQLGHGRRGDRHERDCHRVRRDGESYRVCRD